VKEKQRGTGGEKIWSNRGRKGTQHGGEERKSRRREEKVSERHGEGKNR
jgi:hypothetical protein